MAGEQQADGETRRLPCGHCGGHAEYVDGMVRINGDPACQDCVDEIAAKLGET